MVVKKVKRFINQYDFEMPPKKPLLVALLVGVLLFGAMSMAKASGTPLHDALPGTVINFSGEEWCILEQMANGETYVILSEPAGSRAFDPDNTDVFDLTDSNNVAYFLNNTFYNGLLQKELVVNHSWTRVAYDGGDTIDDGNVTCKVGLLSYNEYQSYSTYYNGDVLPSSYSNSWWTRTRKQTNGLTTNGVWMVIQPGSLFSGAAEDTTVEVHPTLYLQPGLIIDQNNNVGVSNPPAIPSGLTAVANSATVVDLSWQANTEGDLAGYKIFRNNVEIANVGKITSYRDFERSPGTNYTYEILAYNTFGQESSRSDPANVTTASAVTIVDRNQGSYIYFNQSKWLVLEHLSSGETYLWSVDPQSASGTNRLAFDSDNTNLFNPSDPNNVAYLLNTSWYNSALTVHKHLIYDHSWDRASVDASGNAGIDHGNITCKVGLLSYAEYKRYSTIYGGPIPFPSYYTNPNKWTRTPVSNTQSGVWVTYAEDQSINDWVLNSTFEANSTALVHPTIYLSSNLILDANYSVIAYPPPLEKPIGLTAIATSPTSVDLSWQANAEEDLQGYNIYRNNVLIASVGKVTAYTDSTVSPNTTYTYELIAYRSEDESERSNSATVSTASIAPGKPLGLTAIVMGPTSAALFWEANTETDLIGYKIYRDNVVIATVGKVTSYSDNNLLPGTTYTYELVAYGSGVDSERSNPATVTTPSIPPPDQEPDEFEAMWRGNYIEVTWDAGEIEVEGQAVLWRQMENGPWMAIKTLSSEEKVAFSYNDRNVGMGMNCRYEIRERADNDNWFEWRPQAVAESGWATGDRMMAAPAGLRVTSRGDSSASITWNTITGSGTYTVQYSVSGEPWQSYTVSGNSTSVPRQSKVRIRAEGTYSHWSGILTVN